MLWVGSRDAKRGAQNLISSPSFVEDIQICIKLNKSLFDFRAGGDLDWGWGGIGISGARTRDCKIIENPVYANSPIFTFYSFCMRFRNGSICSLC